MKVNAISYLNNWRRIQPHVSLAAVPAKHWYVALADEEQLSRDDTTQRSTMRTTTNCFVLAFLLLGLSQVALGQRTDTAPFELWLNEVVFFEDGNKVHGLEATEEQLGADPLLFENHTEDHAPVLLADGVTQAKYSDLASLMGTMTLTELGEQGTRINISVEGLIPNGLYSAYADVYEPPGFTPDFAHSIGAGALGYPTDNPPADPFDYVGNVFTADANGRGELEVVQSPVGLSWFDNGLIEDFVFPAYVLDPPMGEFTVLLNYHIDGTGSGPRPSAPEGFDAFDGTWIGYSFSTFIVPEPSCLSFAFVALPLLILAKRRSRKVRGVTPMIG